MTVLCTGVEVRSPIGLVHARAILLLSSLDLPARAIVTNVKHFNGKHSCIYCEQEGTTSERSHSHRWWPFESNVVFRTHHSLMENAKEALKEPRTSVRSMWFKIVILLICGIQLTNYRYWKLP